MSKTSSATSEFNLIGQLEKSLIKKGEVKYIILATEQGKYWIKVAKEIREDLAQLSPGCRLEIAGKHKQHPKTGKVKFKAQTVIIIPDTSAQQVPEIKTETVSFSPIFNTQHKSKAKVLICEKSNCWKKGGKKLYDQLEAEFKARGLTDEIPIKKTGCLNKCKQAPNLVMMPDKVRHSQVKPQQIPALIDKHLVAKE